LAWQDDGVTILRVLINDISETAPTNSDDQLEQTLSIAARMVIMDLDFPISYAVDVVNVSITPDPSTGDSKNDSFVNLMAVKAACILDRGGAALSAAQAIMVKDGASQVDLRDVFKAKLALIEKGWCAVYDDMKEEFVYGQTGVTVGAAIIGPFRYFAGYEAPGSLSWGYHPR